MRRRAWDWIADLWAYHPVALMVLVLALTVALVAAIQVVDVIA